MSVLNLKYTKKFLMQGLKTSNNEKYYLLCKQKLILSLEQLTKYSLNEFQKEKVNYIATLIIQSMTGTWRYFHTPEHIFEVGGESDPIEILAALFHDMIYTQVDHGIHINLSGYIYPYVREKQNSLYILPDSEIQQTQIIEFLLLIFDFKKGQNLSPFGGQNEFLSALVAVQCLSEFLPLHYLAEIGACIEATIPFRKHQNGKSPYDFLRERLELVNKKFLFNWTSNYIDEILYRCIRMANRDIENFGSPNPIKFLDNTWNLMPETNHDLKAPSSYSIEGYRTSMTKMLNFLNTLVPEQIFHQYKGEPCDERLLELYENTRRNLQIANLYLQSKILTIGILEALSYRIGRSIALSTLIGEIPVNGMVIPTLDYFLPTIPRPYVPEDPIEEIVLDALTYGRQQETTYDMKNSPITAFLVKAIGFSEVKKLYQKLNDFYAQKIEADTFLAQCDPFVLRSILNGIVKLFRERKRNLIKFPKGQK